MEHGAAVAVMRSALVCALMAAAGPAAAEHHAHTRYGGELGAGYDSNVANSEADADIRESAFFTGGASAEYFHRLNLYTTMVLRGSLQGEHYERYDGLSNAKATGAARLLFRPDGGFLTPVLGAWVSASYWEFDSAIRDSDEYRGGMFANQQLTTRISGRLALSAAWRESDSRVFDTRGASAALNLDWRTADRATLYGGYQFYRGDVVSTAAPTALKIGLAAEEIEPDDAFGGLAADQRAYRLDADAHIGTLGFNYALSPKLSADLQGQYVDTRADYGNEYQRALAVLSLLARF